MIATVKDIVKGGWGLLFYKGEPVFLPGVLPGEKVSFTIEHRRKKVLWGKADKIISASPLRTDPLCPHYGICGGCNFQHIRYRCQLTLKKNILRSALRKIPAADLPPDISCVDSPPFRQRTRMILQVKNGRMGLFRRRSHTVEEIEVCPLMAPNMQDMLSELRKNSSVKNTATGRVILLSNQQEVAALLQGPKKTEYLTPLQEIEFNLDPFRFRVRPDNFVQSNFFTLRSMQQLIEKNCGQEILTAADLFCGAGFLTLALAGSVQNVHAVEAAANNIALLKQNLRINGLTNVRVIRGNALREKIPPADLWVLDPPRTGLSTEFTEKLKTARPQKIICFSCDAATFARDAAQILQTGFHFEKLTLVDNFPQTDHMEICAVFSLPG